MCAGVWCVRACRRCGVVAGNGVDRGLGFLVSTGSIVVFVVLLVFVVLSSRVVVVVIVITRWQGDLRGALHGVILAGGSGGKHGEVLRSGGHCVVLRNNQVGGILCGHDVVGGALAVVLCLRLGADISSGGKHCVVLRNRQVGGIMHGDWCVHNVAGGAVVVLRLRLGADNSSGGGHCEVLRNQQGDGDDRSGCRVVVAGRWRFIFLAIGHVRATNHCHEHVTRMALCGAPGQAQSARGRQAARGTRRRRAGGSVRRRVARRGGGGVSWHLGS